MGERPEPGRTRRDHAQHRRAGPADRRDPAGQPARRQGGRHGHRRDGRPDRPARPRSAPVSMPTSTGQGRHRQQRARRCSACRACCAARSATCSRTPGATAPDETSVEIGSRAGHDRDPRQRPRARRAGDACASASSSPSTACRAPASATAASGLGLALVKSITERHGGSVRCEDRPGGGASFVITLPALGSPLSRAATPAGPWSGGAGL